MVSSIESTFAATQAATLSAIVDSGAPAVTTRRAIWPMEDKHWELLKKLGFLKAKEPPVTASKTAKRAFKKAVRKAVALFEDAIEVVPETGMWQIEELLLGAIRARTLVQVIVAAKKAQALADETDDEEALFLLS